MQRNLALALVLAGAVALAGCGAAETNTNGRAKRRRRPGCSWCTHPKQLRATKSYAAHQSLLAVVPWNQQKEASASLRKPLLRPIPARIDQS